MDSANLVNAFNRQPLTMTFRGAVAQRDSRRPCASGRGGHSCHGSRRRALASRCSSVFFTIAVGILALTDAFCASSPHRIHAHSSQRRSTRQRGATADTTNANIDTAVQILPAQSSPDYALQAIRADLQNRMRTAPAPLEDNEVSRRHAESSIAERFEVDSEGSLVGGIQAEIRLARALALDAVVIVRATSLDMRASLAALSGAAENLLGDARTAQEKLDEYGAMRDYEEGVVSGYAGGGGYGLDQFLETRGKGEGKIAPNIDGDIAPVVLAGRVSCESISDHGAPNISWRSRRPPELDPSPNVDALARSRRQESEIPFLLRFALVDTSVRQRRSIDPLVPLLTLRRSVLVLIFRGRYMTYREPLPYVWLHPANTQPKQRL